MVVAIAVGLRVAVEATARRNVHLTAENRPDALLLTLFVEVNAAVHDAVVGDGSAVHAQFFDLGDVFFDFV